MTEDGLSAQEWYARFAEKIGAEPPTEEEFGLILKLAAEAAHASERTAAPTACWLAARAGIPLREAIEIAKTVNG